MGKAKRERIRRLAEQNPHQESWDDYLKGIHYVSDLYGQQLPSEEDEREGEQLAIQLYKWALREVKKNAALKCVICQSESSNGTISLAWNREGPARPVFVCDRIDCLRIPVGYVKVPFRKGQEVRWQNGDSEFRGPTHPPIEGRWVCNYHGMVEPPVFRPSANKGTVVQEGVWYPVPQWDGNWGRPLPRSKGNEKSDLENNDQALANRRQ